VSSGRERFSAVDLNEGVAKEARVEEALVVRSDEAGVMIEPSAVDAFKDIQ
jgi:hypothetical protein